MASYELKDIRAIYTTGSTAGTAFRRAIHHVEEAERDGWTVVSGWLLEELRSEDEPFTFTFLVQR